MLDMANEPASFTREADERLFAAIGRLTISWGHLELGLDSMVELLYHGFKGKTITPDIPFALKQKIAFLRASFKRMPIGVKAIDGYMKLLNKIESAAQTRHDIIHGFVIEHTEGSGELTMLRATRKKQVVIKRTFKVTDEDTLSAATDAGKLAGIVLNMFNELYDLVQELSQQVEAQK